MASKTKVAMSSPIDRLAALTGERDRLQEQADLVRAAPRALAEAVADIPRVIEQLASRVDVPAGFLAAPGGWGDLAHALGTNSPNEYAPRTPETTLAWCAPELMTAAIERDLRARYAELPEGMSSEAKAAELARLNDQIATIEAEVAVVWWSAIDGGMVLPVPSIPGSTLVGLP